MDCFPGGEWFVQRNLLVKESRYMRQLLKNENAKACKINDYGAPLFGLFLQWLYTGHYQEQDLLVPAFTFIPTCQINLCLSVAPPDSKTMDWCVKASILSWNLGYYLEAPRFQNYAMRRLFSAYSRPGLDKKTSSTVFDYVKDTSSGDSLTQFFEDLIIRNWGDTSIIDHNEDGWLTLLHDDSLHGNFVLGMANSLEERQQNPMNLRKYLVDEDKEQEWRYIKTPKKCKRQPPVP
jgi:hypothetical protein